MKRMNLEASRRAVLGAGMAGIAAAGVARAGETSSGQGNMLAPRPPMGWNSWNSFATTITEAQTREIAAIMADKLLPFGYDILTVDIQWYEPEASSYTYNAKPNPAMDAYGRMIPALNRFPSSAQGRGFAPLAQAVHALGLKFGIHVMRGIPRAAVDRADAHGGILYNGRGRARDRPGRNAVARAAAGCALAVRQCAGNVAGRGLL